MTAGIDSTENEVSVLDLLPIFVRRRRLIGLILGSALLVSVVWLLLAPARYRATSSLIPAAVLLSPPSSGGLEVPKHTVSQLALNFSSARDNPSYLLPRLLGSTALIRMVLSRSYRTRDGRPVSPAVLLGVGSGVDSIPAETMTRSFLRQVRISYDYRSRITTVSATLDDPQLASQLANATAEELRALFQELRCGELTEQASFLSGQVDQAHEALVTAENLLAEFREHNRGTAPRLGLAESRLSRNVAAEEAIYLELRKDLEIARVKMLDAPGILVLDPAVPPVRRSSPRRLSTLALVMIGSGFFAATAALVRERAECGSSWRLPQD